MDWNNVTLGELWEALTEVDWKAPRPLGEFALAPHAFMLPKTGMKWGSRLKNNVYHYRSNYALIFLISFIAFFLRNPMALAAVALMAMGLLCLNDPFAIATNDQLLRVVKKLHARTAMRLRALTNTALDGNLGVKRRSKQRLYILWLPRRAAVGLSLALSLLIMWRSAALRTVAWVLIIGLGLPLLHSTLRSPNLKARLATAKEEFRAVWRGYQAGLQHDYTQ